MDHLKPYCTLVGGIHVTVVVFSDELNDLRGNEMDAGDPFWYIMGTDAWFEKEDLNGVTSLVARTFDKRYLSVPVKEDALNILETEKGVLVLFSKFPFKNRRYKADRRP